MLSAGALLSRRGPAWTGWRGSDGCQRRARGLLAMGGGASEAVPCSRWAALPRRPCARPLRVREIRPLLEQRRNSCCARPLRVTRPRHRPLRVIQTNKHFYSFLGPYMNSCCARPLRVREIEGPGHCLGVSRPRVSEVGGGWRGGAQAESRRPMPPFGADEGTRLNEGLMRGRD